MYLPNTKWTWAFLVTILTQAIVALTLEAYVDGRIVYLIDLEC